MKKNSNSQTKNGQKAKVAKARGPVQRESKEVMAELVAKLNEKLAPGAAQKKATVEKPQGGYASNWDRLTVGVDLGDQWSNYCILGLEGETLAEGQFRAGREDVAEFFQALVVARVVFEVGTHSAWVREVVTGALGFEQAGDMARSRDYGKKGFSSHRPGFRVRAGPDRAISLPGDRRVGQSD